MVRNIEGSKHKAPNEWDTKTKTYDDQPGTEPTNKTNVDDPVVGTNYEANWTVNQTPTDNTIAISNGGWVVTANNDGIEVYNSANQLAYFDFWTDFVSDPTLTGSLYDPKVIYDSESDRCILILLHSSDPSTSKVLVCFSQSNDPSQGWWLYQLNGNVLNNGTWFDYPNVGVSNSDVFVSGNLYVVLHAKKEKTEL